MADIQPEANIMDSYHINGLEQFSADFKTENMTRPVVFNMAAKSYDGNPSKLISTKLIKPSFDQHIRDAM